MKFSKRSRASLERQRELETQLERTNLHITLCGERIEKETGNVERLTEGATKNPQSQDSMYLTDHVRVLESEKADRRAYQKLASRLRAQIAAIENPSASALASRRKQQGRLAGIALRRSKLDRRIGQAVDALRELLGEHERLTTELHNGAYKIDLLIPSEFSDESFTRLAQRLPDGAVCARRSEEWADRFVGRGQKLREYIRLSDFTLPETLAHHHVYNEGGEVYLAEADASALLGKPDAPIRDPKRQAAAMPQPGQKKRFEGWHMPPAQ